MFNSTKKLALAATLSLVAFSANATIIDFANIANNPSPPNPDQGGYQPLIVNVTANLDLTIHGYKDNQEVYAYLDSNTGGLGVCGYIDTNKQCVPSNDDNVTTGESLRFDFTNSTMGGSVPVNINSISFNNNHDGGFMTGNLINLDGTTVDVGSPQGWVTHTVSNPFSAWVTSFTVAYNNRQFYVQTMDVTVPEPSIIALLGLGLIGVGAFSRKAVKRS